MGRPDGSWTWVAEPDGDVPNAVRAGDGRWLTRRPHGAEASAVLHDTSGAALPVATFLRVAAALPREPAPWRVTLGPEGTPFSRTGDAITVPGPWAASQATRHPVDAALARLVPSRSLRVIDAREPKDPPLETIPSPGGVASRVLFFESLMNSDMPHNDGELSQGVLHMASTLSGTGTRAVFANVKMSITDPTQRHIGLESLERALAGGPIELVCITLLEGYWEGVVALIDTLRRLGCRAHVAVGGVMPSLAPEATAAHLPDVSFVCRGAGEYFVPRLARILGPGASIDRALAPDQLDALVAMRGLIAIDRVSRVVVSARSSETVSVESLDAVPLDLDLLEPRHLVHGIEISTARGCIHKCTFCSILGRQSYQARSAAGVLALLQRYEARFRALYGDAVPDNAWRLHISDDDFACDKPRAAEVLRALPSTPFRLSSFQVSIADLCRREGGVLLPEPDAPLVDAITPTCFADAGARVPSRDYVADHRSRRWSAFLAIGVETFSERELRRLGKGYRREHVRAMVAHLAAKGVHMDAYFIASNGETDLDDLVSSVEEVCRLKMRHPEHFHVRFPIVPRLVSYATSASHRRMVLRGERERMVLRAEARVPSHPEMNYDFVEHDVSHDPYVEAVVSAGFFSDEARYTASLRNIRARVEERYAERTEHDPRVERVLRRLDDLPRRLALRTLHEARRAAEADPAARAIAGDVAASVEELLGPSAAWARAYKRLGENVRPTVCVSGSDAAVLGRTIDLVLACEELQPTLRFATRGEEAAWERMVTAVQARVGPEDPPLRVLTTVDDAPPEGARAKLGRSVELTVEIETPRDGIDADVALVRLGPESLARGERCVARLLAARAPRIRLEVEDTTWSAASLALLAQCLHTLSALPGLARALANVADGASCARGDVDVQADGRLVAGDVRVGHLDERGHLERHLAEVPLGVASRGARRVLESFVAWIGEGAREPRAARGGE